jgi:hypothetical protein
LITEELLALVEYVNQLDHAVLIDPEALAVDRDV